MSITRFSSHISSTLRCSLQSCRYTLDMPLPSHGRLSHILTTPHQTQNPESRNRAPTGRRGVSHRLSHGSPCSCWLPCVPPPRSQLWSWSSWWPHANPPLHTVMESSGLSCLALLWGSHLWDHSSSGDLASLCLHLNLSSVHGSRSSQELNWWFLLSRIPKGFKPWYCDSWFCQECQGL